MTTKKWFAYCPETGISFHDTPEAAHDEAELSLAFLGGGALHEQIHEVCWGEVCVHEQATCVHHEETPGGDYDFVETWELEEVDE